LNNCNVLIIFIDNNIINVDIIIWDGYM
jgi:hypothetical protein